MVLKLGQFQSGHKLKINAISGLHDCDLPLEGLASRWDQELRFSPFSGNGEVGDNHGGSMGPEKHAFLGSMLLLPRALLSERVTGG